MRPFLVGWRPKSSDARVASVRIRCLTPLRELQRRGYPVELFAPARQEAYSVVIYSKLYDPATQAQARGLQASGTRIVLDLCDNHFYNPGDLQALHEASAQLRRMIDVADELVASTAPMADVLHAEATPGKPVTIIGDAAESRIEGVPTRGWARWWSRRRLRGLAERVRADRGRTPLVWFGSHGGPSGDHGMGDLVTLRPLLESLNRQHPLSLTVISNSVVKFARMIRPWHLPTHYLGWSAETFLAALRLHAIAVIPVRENPFTRCKSNNRLVTAMTAGLAVVADAVPSYRAFEGCCELGDWPGGLRRYLSDPDKRHRDVAAGQGLIQRDWSVPVIGDRWERFLDAVRERGATR